MCHRHPSHLCLGCGHAVTRRGFLKGCTAAALAVGGLNPAASEPATAWPHPVGRSPRTADQPFAIAC